MGPDCRPTGALARDYTVSRVAKEALSGQYFRRVLKRRLVDLQLTENSVFRCIFRVGHCHCNERKNANETELEYRTILYQL